jgi:hypothetical protein
MDGARERTFLDALATVGGALGRALAAAYFGDGAPGASLLVGLLLLLLAVLLLLLALQLLLRLALLGLLIATMPLFLALHALPATAWLAGLWLRWFFPAVFLQALQVTILALGHEWLRAAHGDLARAPGGALLPLLMAMATLLLTLRAPALLAAGQNRAVDAAGLAAGAARAGLAAAAAARARR